MKKILFISILTISMVVFAGCVESNTDGSIQPNTDVSPSTSAPSISKYAEEMNLTYYDENGNAVNPYNGDKWAYKLLIDSTGQKILLKNESQKIPKWAEGKYDIVINVPLKNVVVMSSTHIALMEAINDDNSVISSIKGIMWGKSYKWYFEDINESLECGKIVDVGSTTNPNWDLIVNISPEVIFVYPGYSGDAIIEKSKELGITYVADAEYRENSYLGRCEWVKMFAAFYNKESEAKGYFNSIENNAVEIQTKLKDVNENLSVVWGYNSKWGCYVPRGNSYVVKGIELCGGNYVFEDLNGTGSEKIDYEVFAERARNADVWVISSSTDWISDFKDNHPGYQTFKSVKNDRVFCRSDDYYQMGLLHTDIVLMDLATILHPEEFKGRETHFLLKYNIENNSATPFIAG
jgi:iron complex transport system substrate-binding protein